MNLGIFCLVVGIIGVIFSKHFVVDAKKEMKSGIKSFLHFIVQRRNGFSLFYFSVFLFLLGVYKVLTILFV
jgi:hypothetical protein